MQTPLDALVRLSDDEWRRLLAVHLDGTFFCTRAAARLWHRAAAGVIVNMASVCGIEGCTGHPHYSAAKAGILGFTKAVAKELIVQGIRVNAVAPGHVDTSTLKGQLDASRSVIANQTPAGRLAGRRRSRRPWRSWPPTTPPTTSGRRSAPTAASSPLWISANRRFPACSTARRRRP